MSGLRHDPLHDTWVIVAPDRERRPSDQRLQTVADVGGVCPFCPGNERETPPEVLALGRGFGLPADGPPWRVRVFPNRFPAVVPPDGRHEVVVIAPEHDRDLADLPAADLAAVLAAIQTRVRALEQDPQLAAVLFFLNAGAGAGASLTHPHGQLLATRIVPGLLRTELDACARWRRRHGECLLCASAAAAARDDRVIAQNDGAVAYVPFASRFAWEVLIQPAGHGARFSEAPAEVLGTVAAALGAACRALATLLDRPSYNLVLHTAPRTVEDFHWHLELLPRLAPLAGFETGTGFFVNPVVPELAAAALRRATGGGPREDLV